MFFSFQRKTGFPLLPHSFQSASAGKSHKYRIFCSADFLDSTFAPDVVLFLKEVIQAGLPWPRENSNIDLLTFWEVTYRIFNFQEIQVLAHWRSPQITWRKVTTQSFIEMLLHNHFLKHYHTLISWNVAIQSASHIWQGNGGQGKSGESWGEKWTQVS